MGAGVVRRIGLEMGCVYYKGQLALECSGSQRVIGFAKQVIGLS